MSQLHTYLGFLPRVCVDKLPRCVVTTFQFSSDYLTRRFFKSLLYRWTPCIQRNVQYKFILSLQFLLHNIATVLCSDYHVLPWVFLVLPWPFFTSDFHFGVSIFMANAIIIDLSFVYCVIFQYWFLNLLHFLSCLWVSFLQLVHMLTMCSCILVSGFRSVSRLLLLPLELGI